MNEGKLLRAKMGILLEHPFFATLMMRKKFIPDPSIKTASTNGKDLKFNPAFFDGLPPEELKGVICHELLHTSMFHHTRRGDRDLSQWNEACDYAINPIILSSGMKLPSGVLINASYDGKTAEEVYRLLGQKKEEEKRQKEQEEKEKEDDQGEDQDQNNDSPGDEQNPGEDGQGDQPGEEQGDGQPGDEPNPDPGGCGGVEDSLAQSESEITETEAEVKMELAQAAFVAKQQGRLPADLERLVQELLEPKIAWQEVLARFLSQVSNTDYSFSKPNARYLGSGFILPSLHNLEIGEIVLIADVSGSIDEDLLNKFATEMQEVAADSKSPITVLYVDIKVQGEPQIVEPDDTFKLEERGGGGTDFRPGFKWLEEQGITPKCVVYFTDLECDDYPDEPEFPVLWANWGDKNNKAPFGEVVQID